MLGQIQQINRVLSTLHKMQSSTCPLPRRRALNPLLGRGQVEDYYTTFRFLNLKNSNEAVKIPIQYTHSDVHIQKVLTNGILNIMVK